MHALVLAAESPGAGGSPVDQIIIATVGAIVVTAALLWFGLGHRSGKVAALGRLAAFSERVSGIPGWAALPTAIATSSLLIAVFGMYWDIALHVDIGRDEGPLANPAHYFILFGLYGIFGAGVIAMVLPEKTGGPGPTAVRITKDWYAPLGGVLITACGAFALIGFPLDDVWHRIFGQDVTLWGPTHLMLIGGASMTLIGIAVLVVEGLRTNAAMTPPREEKGWIRQAQRIALTGGLLLGLSTFQAEFDFGIQQFRFVMEPLMIMVAAGVGLVSIRTWGGRGSAVGGVLFFLAVRGILSLLVGPVLGQTTPAAPLYLASAIVVELVALRVATTKPLAFGLWSGLGIGTVGLASEWGWSHLVMPIPLPASMLVLGVSFGFIAAIAASVVGAWIGTRLHQDPVPTDRPLRLGAVAGALTIALLFAIGLPKPPTLGQSATVTLTDITAPAGDVAAGGRAVKADIRVDPPRATDDNYWFTVTAWQGGGLVVDRLRKLGPGHYETTEPIPVHGDWKAMIRFHKGRSIDALPIYLPKDDAIPAKEVPADAQFTRPFIADHEVLQREQQPAAPVVSFLAYVVVGLITLALLVLLIWGLHRLGDPKGALRKHRDRSAKASGRAPSPTATPQTDG